jgi:hypothetical protein
LLQVLREVAADDYWGLVRILREPATRSRVLGKMAEHSDEDVEWLTGVLKTPPNPKEASGRPATHGSQPFLSRLLNAAVEGDEEAVARELKRYTEIRERLMDRAARKDPYDAPNFKKTHGDVEESITPYDRVEASERMIGAIVDLSRELHTFISAIVSGVDVTRLRVNRYIPVRIYIGGTKVDQDRVDEVLYGINESLSHDFSLSDEFEPELGSWWGRLFYKTKKAVTSDEARRLVERGLDAAEAHALAKPQSEANLNNAKAVKEISEALKDVEHAAVQVGHMLAVKTVGKNGKPVMAVRTLSPAEARRLEEDPALLQDPSSVLDLLAAAASTPPVALPAKTAKVLEDSTTKQI